MSKKHIRTIIISLLALLAVIITVLSIDIEPAEKSSLSQPLSAAVTETEKPQEEAQKEAITKEEQEKVKTEAPVEEKAEVKEEKSAEEKKTEVKKAAPLEEKAEAQKEAPAEEQKAEFKNEPQPEEQAEEVDTSTDTKPKDEKTVPDYVNIEESAPAVQKKHFCTIEIRCDTVKDTTKLENQAVAPYVPKDGTILATTQMEFTPGESVFDILLRATKENNIHMEFRDENAYSGKYIEGINYLYEMDAGSLSGWMYKVNDKFPNYGCSNYKVEDEAEIVWIYTCDLGIDVGDNSTW